MKNAGLSHAVEKPEKPWLIVIGGPTASGKTDAAIRMAQVFGTEIVSADSRQVFQEMNIGTAKPTPTQLSQAPHHLIGHRSVTQSYSAGRYSEEALAVLRGIFRKTNIAILTGGSGLYIKAVCEGLDQFPDVSEHSMREASNVYEEGGLEALQIAVRKSDPEYFRRVDIRNPHRLLRALSLHIETGGIMADWQTDSAAMRPFSPIYIQLAQDRNVLYERINRRVDEMLEAGLEKEARMLYPQRTNRALQTVGYQEFFDYFEGKIDFQEAIRLMKRNSRRYAKRQLTWLRRDGFWSEARDVSEIERIVRTKTGI